LTQIFLAHGTGKQLGGFRGINIENKRDFSSFIRIQARTRMIGQTIRGTTWHASIFRRAAHSFPGGSRVSFVRGCCDPANIQWRSNKLLNFLSLPPSPPWLFACAVRHFLKTKLDRRIIAFPPYTCAYQSYGFIRGDCGI